ncbi:MAG: hypothetical protein H7246_22795, partial [Phycisphaerae bacterium]|nr:hypothetical protein [Saprospiraceae bacterium]
MDNLDDLMRQKFDSDDPGARFEFREEYWEQAQVLLEQDEARRRRRLWIFIGLVLALALLAWLLMLRLGAGSMSHNKQGEQDSMGENVPRQEESSKQIPPPNSSQSIEIENSDAGKTDNLSGGSTQPGAKTESSELRVPAQDKSLRSGVGKNGASKPYNKGNTLGTYTQSGKNTSGSPTPKGASNAGAAQQIQDRKNDRINADQLDNSLVKSNQSSDQPPITNPLSPVTNPQSPITNHQSPVTNHQSPVTNPESPITNPQSPTTIPIFYLPIPLTLLKWSERVVAPKLILVPKQPIAEQTKPVQDHRFSLGLSLAGAAYQPSDTEERWAGWVIGAYGKYHLNKNWALMLGAQG